MQNNVTTSYPLFSLEGRSESDFRNALKDYFQKTWALYECLFEVIKDDSSYYLRPCSLRHPLIFYFGHTATFFMNKLVLAKQLDRVNPKFESMFAIGVDEMSWDDLNDAHYDWPSVDAVREYRAQVRAAIVELIDRVEIQLPINWQSPVWPILMGIEHERIHLETSSVLIRQLPIDCVQSHAAFPLCPAQQTPVPNNTLLSVPAGEVVIDHQDPAKLYGWDNEYGKHRAEVVAFEAGAMLVSNAEFLRFVEAGGYQNTAYWTAEGQGWLSFSQAQFPSFWLKKGDVFYLRCMAEEIPMPWAWPAEVNYLEAKAYCNWLASETGKPIRLPSEDEYLRLRDWAGLAGKETAIGLGMNLNLSQYASSTPVDANHIGGVYDLVGNVWQWTETPIYPFDGFKVHPLYDDFTTPTFDNKHNIFKGGSWISTGNEANLHSRYAFRRHFFQHAGFRYIASDAPVITQYTPYETEADVVQACDTHFGTPPYGIANYSVALADWTKMHLPVGGHWAEFGCSVGRTSLQLSSHATQLTALDRSARFIRVANAMQTEGRVRYRLTVEGEIPDFVEARSDVLGLPMANNVQFLQQDFNNLKEMFTGYDVLILNNMLSQLAQPVTFLAQIHQRLNPQGYLLVASDFAWDETNTAVSDRLGGYKQDGENVSSDERLCELLSQYFAPVANTELPLVRRFDARHHAIDLVEVSLWQRR